MNPDGNRGSFFPAVQNRYRSPERLKTASDHLQYARAMVDEMLDHDEDVSRGTCEVYSDHVFHDDPNLLHTIACEKCGMMAEHPDKWRLEHEP